MATQLAALGLPWQRVGYDGRRQCVAEIAAFADARFPAVRFDFAGLSGAEIGCWLSHLAAWRQLAETPGVDACVVLEDDVVLSAGLAVAVEAIARCDAFDVVYLGTSSRNISTRQRLGVGNFWVHVPVGTILNTWGYVLRRSFATTFLQIPRTISLPIDRYVGAGRKHADARVGVIQPVVVCEDPVLGARSQIEPFTFRADRWRAVEAIRRRILVSRVSELYYRLYRFL